MVYGHIYFKNTKPLLRKLFIQCKTTQRLHETIPTRPGFERITIRTRVNLLPQSYHALYYIVTHLDYSQKILITHDL